MGKVTNLLKALHQPSTKHLLVNGIVCSSIILMYWRKKPKINYIPLWIKNLIGITFPVDCHFIYNECITGSASTRTGNSVALHYQLYTANALWTDEHTSQKMLEYYFDPHDGKQTSSENFIEERPCERPCERIK